ncbi:unnamed protein product [Cuscuta campestris]|uniref:Pentacotripeptide-repeat region of PRORP domain-containing protein n=1 Tax=Cuscuta campestris TaxID=132261 RepID=A0A484KU95_9ASTE|nr:unnamed protein product [Cuscuta campestris]
MRTPISLASILKIKTHFCWVPGFHYSSSTLYHGRNMKHLRVTHVLQEPLTWVEIRSLGGTKSLHSLIKLVSTVEQPVFETFNNVLSNRYGDVSEAWELFSEMRRFGFEPTQYTFGGLLSCEFLDHHRTAQLHALIEKTPLLHIDAVVGTALLSTLGRCGCLHEAWQVFESMPRKNLVTWNSMILLLGKHGFVENSMKMFIEMLRGGMDLSEYTFAGLLSCFVGSSSIELGEQVHAVALKHGLVVAASVKNSLANMLKNQSLGEAFHAQIIKKRHVIDVKVGSAMCHQWQNYCRFTHACSRNGDHKEAFELFGHMQRACVFPDNYTYISLFSSCTVLCNLGLGSSLHSLLIKNNFNSCDTFVCNVMIDMYAKCGSLDSSIKIFFGITIRNVFSWTTIISSLGLHGYAHEAIEKFEEMIKDGIMPDKVALMSVLSACRHAGLVEQGMSLFREMNSKMPFPPNALIWRTFLDGCKRKRAMLSFKSC